MSEFLYQGVSARYPEWATASLGIVMPARPDADLSPTMHNLGSRQHESPYTSWTAVRERAEFHRDKEGPGGLLLRLEQRAPGEDEDWWWEWSPDVYYEEEMLLHGVRMDAEVIR